MVLPNITVTDYNKSRTIKHGAGPLMLAILGDDGIEYMVEANTSFTEAAIPVSIIGGVAPTGNFNIAFIYNGVEANPEQDTGTPSDNRGMPSVILAGQGLAPLDVNTGAAGTTTLRTVISSRSETVTTPLATRISNGTDFNSATAPVFVQLTNGSAGFGVLDFGVSSAALRVAALMGNATGAADFNTGSPGAQTLRTVISSRSETVTTPLAFRMTNKDANDWASFSTGASDISTMRVAANITREGNQFNYNYGAPTENTIQTASMLGLGSTAVSASNPVPTRMSDGTNFYGPYSRTQNSVYFAGDNIAPSSGSRYLAATLTAACKKLYFADTTGIFVAWYDASGSGNKLFTTGPGFPGDIDMALPNGTTLYGISETSSAGDSNSAIAISFVG